MSESLDWGQRLEALLTGALAIWRIDGQVERDANGICILETEQAKVTIARVTDDGDPYWEVGNPNGDLPPLPFGGIQGMLRAVKESVGADETGTRLVIGPQDDR